MFLAAASDLVPAAEDADADLADVGCLGLGGGEEEEEEDDAVLEELVAFPRESFAVLFVFFGLGAKKE